MGECQWLSGERYSFRLIILSSSYVNENLLYFAMILLSQVWQAFVGVRTRRVEGYYQDLLGPETDAGDSKERFDSCGVPMKSIKQIEKVIK